MSKDKRYYVFIVRITDKGGTDYKKKIHRVMTKAQMTEIQRDLAKTHKVSMKTIGFSYEEYIGIWQIIKILLNEIKAFCIM